jgi:hypothetical protein
VLELGQTAADPILDLHRGSPGVVPPAPNQSFQLAPGLGPAAGPALGVEEVGRCGAQGARYDQGAYLGHCFVSLSTDSVRLR